MGTWIVARSCVHGAPAPDKPDAIALARARYAYLSAKDRAGQADPCLSMASNATSHNDMALRIYFPWQLLLTVFGFAVLGASVGYLQAHDFHGQLYRQLAVHATGAGFLGAWAWFLSERVSHAVNLNTSS